MRRLLLVSPEVLQRIYEGQSNVLRSIKRVRRRCAHGGDQDLCKQVDTLQTALREHIDLVVEALRAVNEKDNGT